MAGLRVAMLGASGNVGRRVLQGLLDADVDVVCFDRRPMGDVVHARLVRYVVDMDLLEEQAAPLLADVDVIVATLGIGSGIGRLAQFRRVEVELPSAFARAAVTAGVRRAVLLTSAGADVDKRFVWWFAHVARGQYFHLKGLVEQRFFAAGFGHVVVFRPGGLLGTDHFPSFVDSLVVGLDRVLPAAFHSIHIDDLAATMVAATLQDGEGQQVLEGPTLQDYSPTTRN